jgi:hypothetical protein
MGRVTANIPRFTARHALVVALAATLHATASFALGTDEQRAACTPDVFRLCSSAIPNVDQIIACLKQKKASLSVGCQAVFNAPQQAAATRSMATPETEWCLFGKGVQESVQQNWLNWCGDAAHRQ